MGSLTRFGVSLDSNLLEKFDALISARGYTNRSEALRDMIRDQLIKEDWKAGSKEAVAAVSLVYDHHELELPKRLTDLQHEHHGLVVSALHVHLTHHHCLEILVLRGRGDRIKKLGHSLVGTNGIKHGEVFFTTTGDTLE